MKQNIAVIGCGYWGRNLVRNFSEIRALAAVCDPDSRVGYEISREYGVPCLSYEDILESEHIEGVVLAVPAPMHCDMALRALEANKHVFVEKPLAMNVPEALKMIELAELHNCELMVGHLLQYHPAFLKLNQLVLDGYFGELTYVYSNRLSFGKIRDEEDVIWSFAPHDISMILKLANSQPVEVKTVSSSILRPNIADKATISMRFENGLRAHAFVSWLHPYKEQKLVVIGDKAMAVFDDTKGWNEKLSVYEHDVSVSGTHVDLKKAEGQFVEVDQAEPLQNECLHFIDVVSRNVKPKTDGEEGRRVLEVLSAATRSIKSAAPLEASY